MIGLNSTATDVLSADNAALERAGHILPQFHDWDPTPHVIYEDLGVADVRLSDVILGGTHQVEGFGSADQRGHPAIRLDLQYLVTDAKEMSARLILPIGQSVGEVKRYTPGVGHAWAWVQLRDNTTQHSNGTITNDVPAPGVVPDYGSRTEYCCGDGAAELNPLAEDGGTMCDDCAHSWGYDYVVVRHHR